MRDRTEKPQDEHEAMRPAPVYPKCVYGHSATGPRVMNPAFHFVSGRVFFRAAHVSCTCIFSRVNRCTCAAHVCATIPARGCRFSARIGCTCARTWGTCGIRTVRIRVGLSHSRLAERYTGENKQSCHQPPFRLRILSPNRRKLSGNDSVTV